MYGSRKKVYSFFIKIEYESKSPYASDGIALSFHINK